MENGIENEEFNGFLALHLVQLQASGVPEIYWENLFNKLKNETFDAGESFQLAQIENEEEEDETDWFHHWKVLACTDISLSDPKHIYLIDHAWTFRPDQARTHLKTVDVLVQRMCNLMGISQDSNDKELCIKEVLENMWKYSQNYSIGNPNLEAEDRVPVWYVMDEFGSRIQHSDEPTFRVVPFYYMNEQACYSLLFPKCDLEEGEEVTRNFVEGSGEDAATRAALLSPWSKDFVENYLSGISLEQSEPGDDYFTASRQNESLPSFLDGVVPSLPTDRPIRAYVEYEFIRQFLKHPRFELVDNADEADVLWLSSHFKDFHNLSETSPHKRINQFPCEHILTVKDLLSIVGRRGVPKERRVNRETLETLPAWLPTTFNLKTELPQFLAFYHARKDKGLPNTWIVKPWNLARSLDSHVTDNVDFITRLAMSGPKIAQKYIERPVLFHRQDIDARVKFDVRYIILLRSVKPLEAYVYKRFWLRFANKPFELDHFDEYERHFTVMNYSATNLHQMFCHDFIRYFEEQNPDQKWSNVEGRIFTMIKELLTSSITGGLQSSLVHNPQSAAMYATDILLSWTDEALDGDETGPSIQPKLLEVNWAPDCKRACNYYPEFFDDVFSVLFLGETEGRNVHKL